jgi:hypothetical protein
VGRGHPRLARDRAAAARRAAPRGRVCVRAAVPAARAPQALTRVFAACASGSSRSRSTPSPRPAAPHAAALTSGYPRTQLARGLAERYQALEKDAPQVAAALRDPAVQGVAKDIMALPRAQIVRHRATLQVSSR